MQHVLLSCVKFVTCLGFGVYARSSGGLKHGCLLQFEAVVVILKDNGVDPDFVTGGVGTEGQESDSDYESDSDVSDEDDDTASVASAVEDEDAAPSDNSDDAGHPSQSSDESPEIPNRDEEAEGKY